MLNGGKYSVCRSILLGTYSAQKFGLQLLMLNIKYVVAIPWLVQGDNPQASGWL